MALKDPVNIFTLFPPSFPLFRSFVGICCEPVLKNQQGLRVHDDLQGVESALGFSFSFKLLLFKLCRYFVLIHLWCSLGPEKGIGSLELELQARVSCHVEAGNQTWLLWNRSQ